MRKQNALQQIQHEPMGVNPSAARSLEEGLEHTLTLHRLRVPESLRKRFPTTNPIESIFDTIRVACRNVKRLGDQKERWIGSGLLFAEQKFRRIDGYRELPQLVSILDAQCSSHRRR